VAGGVTKKGVIAPAIGTNLQEGDLNKFDERGTVGNGPSRRRGWGLGGRWRDALERNKFEKDLMESSSEENSGRGRE